MRKKLSIRFERNGPHGLTSSYLNLYPLGIYLLQVHIGLAGLSPLTRCKF